MVDIQELVKIRRELETQIPAFPVNGCNDAANRLKDKGLQIVQGLIRTAQGWEEHLFGYNQREHAYVDISADQFHGHSKKVLITPVNNNSIYRHVNVWE